MNLTTYEDHRYCSFCSVLRERGVTNGKENACTACWNENKRAQRETGLGPMVPEDWNAKRRDG